MKSCNLIPIQFIPNLKIIMYQLERVKLLKKYIIMVFAITFMSSSISCGQSHVHKSEALFEAMNLKEGNWAADVGGGDGDYTVRMSPIVKDSGHIFLVDIDHDKLEELHEELEEREINNVTPVYSVPGNPMLPASSLDAILVRNAYHEFRNYMSMLQHMKQALKPGGRLVMAEPIEEDLIDASREEQADDHDIAMHYALEDLKEAGFRIVKKVDHFTSNSHQRYWMVIAERPMQ